MIYNNDKLIAAAFVKARAEIGGTVGKDAKGNFGRYATLAAITDATSAALGKHGLAIIQEATLTADGVTVETCLLHESGATIQFAPLVMPLKDRTPQSVGSAITYGRKYQWAAVCGLAADDSDDDGQAAQPKRTVDTSAGAIAQPGPSAGLEGDVVFAKRTLLSHDQEEELMGLGKTFYGENWGKEQVRLAKAASKGVVSRIADLVPKEADRLIVGLQKEIAEAEQTIAAQPHSAASGQAEMTVAA